MGINSINSIKGKVNCQTGIEKLEIGGKEDSGPSKCQNQLFLCNYYILENNSLHFLALSIMFFMQLWTSS